MYPCCKFEIVLIPYYDVSLYTYILALAISLPTCWSHKQKTSENLEQIMPRMAKGKGRSAGDRWKALRETIVEQREDAVSFGPIFSTKCGYYSCLTRSLKLRQRMQTRSYFVLVSFFQIRSLYLLGCITVD